MQLQKRNVAVYVILSVVTGGIFGLYWQYLLIRDTRSLKTGHTRSGDELFAMIIIPFYHVYWWIRTAKTAQTVLCRNGKAPKGKIWMYALFSLLFLDVVNAALLQSSFNATDGAEIGNPVATNAGLENRLLLLFRCLGLFPLIPLYWLYGGMPILYGGGNDHTGRTPITAETFLIILIVLSSIGVLLIAASLIAEAVVKHGNKQESPKEEREDHE